MRFFKAAPLLALLLVSLPASPRQNVGQNERERADFDKREEAYRANNLGVALLEQFRHAEGAEAFRRALRVDPRAVAPRINLAVALFNVPDLAEALKAAREAADAAPRAPQPRYLLGLIARQQNRPEDALAEFRRVHEVDPNDVGTNVNLGQLLAQRREYKEAITHFRAAVAAEPYNGTALYNLGTSLLRAGEREEGQRVIQKFQDLRQSGAATTVGNNYLEQGRYAEAVTTTGAEAELVERATPRVSFADATSDVLRFERGFGSAGRTVKPPLSLVRRLQSPNLDARTKAELASSLGGGVTLFDLDGDGRLDLFDAAPATPVAPARLFRNDGSRLVEITRESGVAADFGGVHVGAVAGDYDNDGLADLFVLRYGTSSLYRNLGGGRFADVTKEAGLPAYSHLPSSSAFVDYDHDGDLDLFVAGFVSLEGARPSAPGAPVVFPDDFAPAPNLLLRNNGDGTFADVTAAAKVGGAATRALAVVPTDYDNRRDVDLLVLNYKAAPALYRNLRDGSFADVSAEVGLAPAVQTFAAAAGDVNKDEFTDFFFAAGETQATNGGAGKGGAFALSDARGRFRLSSPQGSDASSGAAQMLDYDNDGLLDLVSVSTAGVRVLRNVGDGWTDVSASAFTPGKQATLHPRVLASADFDSDGDTDLFVRNEAGALRVLRNEGGSRNASVRVRLAGKVSNRAGVGAKVEVRAGSLQQKLETYSASPAPAPADVTFGLGRRAFADAVRVLWPSGVVQAETEVPRATAGSPGVAAAQAVTLPVTELDRKPSSCPYLYAWNGERFEFVTDFMGGGELGYWAAPGVRAAPDPDEYVRIRGDQLRERAGRYELRVTNELEEALFVDRLQLVSVAHPAGVEVYPNEGLGNPTSGAARLYATRDARPPRAARDGHGHDVLARVSKLDRRYPDDFKLTHIRGYAEPHELVLDLGREEEEATNDERRDVNERQLVSHSSFRVPRSSLVLLLTGWTDYAFSSDNVAAAQAGMSLSPPELQVRDARGRWRTVIKNIGIPVGRPQTVAVDLSGAFLSSSREVRILSNMRIYWDEIRVGTSDAGESLRVERLEAASADLRWRGFSAATTPDGREPLGYDFERVSYASPWKVLPGLYTREGDVRELLAAVDDMFVVSRPGDAVALSFDARALAPLPAGWTRTFLLYADGFSKEMDINSASPHELAPLPFHGMKNYPYSAPESYPSTPAHRAYVEKYNTRAVSAPLTRMLWGN